MELHVRNVIVLKMPIILVSVDSDNMSLVDFNKMQNIVVDVVFESTDPRSKAIVDILETKMIILKRFALDRLNERGDDESEEDAGIRVLAAVNAIRKLNVGSGMIISHHSVFSSWDSEAIKDGWNVIGMN
jgi:hypothetical protein